MRRPSIGLSEIAKLSGYNKATALRFLNALESKGFVEQDPETRTYKLGLAFMRFAQLRESSFPWADAVNLVLRELNAETDETALASVISGDSLVNIGVVESTRLNRVLIEPGIVLPFHATASGLAYLAFAKPDRVEAALYRELETHTPNTLTNAAKISEKLNGIRQAGIAHVSGSFDEGVMAIAAPYFGPNGESCGAVAIGMPTVRGTPEHNSRIERAVCTAARKLTTLRGGDYPADFCHDGLTGQ